MIPQDQFKKIEEMLGKAEKVLIPLHLHPDGDMVGSALALALYLRELGKEVKVVSADPVPPEWNFLPFYETIREKSPLELGLSDFDLVAFLDVVSPSRVVHEESFKLPPGLPSFNIDHHVTNEKDCNFNLVDVQASSTTQILTEFFRQVDSLDQEKATLLYWGLLTDTGVFEYGVNLERVHHTAACLLAYGVPHGEFIFHLKHQLGLAEVRFLSRALENLSIDEEYGFSYTTVSYRELKELDLVDQVGEIRYTIKPYVKGMKGTAFGFSLIEIQPGEVKGSLRSRKEDLVDVSVLAQQLGGGGLRGAAGFYVHDEIEKAAELVLKEARNFVQKNDLLS